MIEPPFWGPRMIEAAPKQCYWNAFAAWRLPKLRAAVYQWRVYREIEKLPVLHSLSCMAAYLCGAIADR